MHALATHDGHHEVVRVLDVGVEELLAVADFVGASVAVVAPVDPGLGVLEDLIEGVIDALDVLGQSTALFFWIAEFCGHKRDLDRAHVCSLASLADMRSLVIASYCPLLGIHAVLIVTLTAHEDLVNSEGQVRRKRWPDPGELGADNPEVGLARMVTHGDAAVSVGIRDGDRLLLAVVELAIEGEGVGLDQLLVVGVVPRQARERSREAGHDQPDAQEFSQQAVDLRQEDRSDDGHEDHGGLDQDVDLDFALGGRLGHVLSASHSGTVLNYLNSLAGARRIGCGLVLTLTAHEGLVDSEGQAAHVVYVCSQRSPGRTLGT